MNLFKLVATVGLDTSEYDRKSDQVVQSGHQMAGKLGSAVKGAAKVAAAGVAAATTAIGAFTAMAVKNFAEYEQLAGGVETLFKSSADKVKGYAAEAYKTAGMSGNQYMETVTGFSASLIKSLGGDTEIAADIANQAVIDMSDNANKMGTDIKSIQFAYQGFAKQNYTMLDNLKLGYGGTKTEMERLIKDANKVKKANGEMADLSIDSFADVTEAIHIMQEQMGIAGATADEAATTIEGSINAAKGAWHNFVTGFGRDDADMVQLTDDLVESVAIAAHNIIPRVEKVLGGLEGVGERVAPLIAKGITTAAERSPEFVKTGMSVLSVLGSALVSNSPELIDSAFLLLNALLDGLNSDPDAIFDGAETLITTLGEKIEENGPTLFDKGTVVLGNLIDGLVDASPDMLIASIEIMAALAEGCADNLPELTDRVPEWINTLADEFSKPDNRKRIKDAGVKIGTSLMEGIYGTVLPGAYDLWKWFYKLVTDPEAAMKDLGKVAKGTLENPLGMISGFFTGEYPIDLGDGTPVTPAKPTKPGPPSGYDYDPLPRIPGRPPIEFNSAGYISPRALTGKAEPAQSTVFSGLTINVNGAKYNNLDDLTDAIAYKLQDLADRRLEADGL